MGTQRRALLSVSDKTGLVPLARALAELGFEIVSSGGTAQALKDAKISARSVSDVTGFPEILGGRVKTLHPLIHGGLLAVPGDATHEAEIKQHGIDRFDVVVVNLYPFEAGLRDEAATPQDLVELIDIGGPTLVRAAAKNYAGVTVVVDPADYDRLLHELRTAGNVADATRLDLAAKAFAHTADYDAMVAHWLRARAGGPPLASRLVVPLRRRAMLRYGENHHQKGAFYEDALGLFGNEPSVSTQRQLHGKELSYNNILDGDTAVETLKEFHDPTVVIIKHATPSGIASAPTLVQAWKDAYATDTYSPFGGVVAVNRPVTVELADELSAVFLELILAPGFEKPALERLRKKKNIRLLEIPGLEADHERLGLTMRSVTGGVLVQERDARRIDSSTWRAVTKKKPTEQELASLAFAAACVKHVRSNAVVFAKDTRTVGIGGGQTARVDAVYIATKKGAGNIRGSVLASDAFFPFRDTVDAAAKAGVAAIVQPGGSIRDAEVIQAADEHGIAMVFSDHRSFRH